MADFVYPYFRGKNGGDLGGLATLDWRCIIFDDTNYVVSSAHTTIQDVAANARIRESVCTAEAFTTTNAQFDLGDVLFQSASASATVSDGVDGLLFYVVGAASASSYLALHIDSPSNLPLTVNGGDLTIQLGAYLIGF